MNRHARELVEDLADWLSDMGWRGTPRRLLTRLATLVDEEDVLYWDADISGDPRQYEATIVLFTPQRVFVQTISHARGERTADLGVQVVRRSSVRSLTSTTVAATPYGVLERCCDRLHELSPAWGRRGEAVCAWLADRVPGLHDHHPDRWQEDEEVCVDLTYPDLPALRLPLYPDCPEDDPRHDFAGFLPSLVADLR